MLRQSEHVGEPPGVGGKSDEVLLEGKLVEQGVFLELMPGKKATNSPEPSKNFKP